MTDVQRVGIIGAGTIAQARHIPLLQAVPGVDVTHAWSRTFDTANKVAMEFGIPNVVDRWEQIVETPDIDAVVIATPPNLHMPATIAALDSGKHVLCQGRMARNLSEALKMLSASNAADLVTALYAPRFGLKGDRVIRRLLHDGYVGDVLEVRVTAMVPSLPRQGAWVLDPVVMGVNTMTLGILVEVANRWFGPARSVTAVTGEPPLAVPQSLSISVELLCGSTASFHMSFRVPYGSGSSVEIYGTRGVLVYRQLVEKFGVLMEDEELIGMTTDEHAMHHIEMPLEEQRDRTMDKEFIEAIRNGAQVSPDFVDGVLYMEFCEAVAQSIYEKRTISIPPAPKMRSWGSPI